jgi:hypothetical protein
MDFEAWKTELFRIWKREGGAFRRARKIDAEIAFERGVSPWTFFEENLSAVRGVSVDDIPILGEDD